jgi:alpha-ketoglutarate-dependent taurine dioxygenase
LSLTTAEEPTGMPSTGLVADLAKMGNDLKSKNPKEAAEALRVVQRRNGVDFLLKYLFGVLMNTHYGVTPVWGKFEGDNGKNTKSAKKSKTNYDESKNTTASIDKSQVSCEQPEQIDHLDTAYLSVGIDLHTDQTYSLHSPKLQGFGLIHSDPKTSKGGANVLADGFAVAQYMSQKYPKQFEVLKRNSIPAHYAKDGRFLSGFRPVFKTASNSSSAGKESVSQISFNSYDRASAVVFDFSDEHATSESKMLEKMNEFYEAYTLFGDLCHDRANYTPEKNPSFAFQLQPSIGKLLIFDNHRCLHARTSFVGPRIMCGSYVSLDDYFSALNHYQL